MRRVVGLAGAWILLGATGCAGGQRPPQKNACQVAMEEGTPDNPFWEGEPTECPSGYDWVEAQTTPISPGGKTRFCADESGRRHGPTRSEGKDGKALEIGWFVENQPHGTWRKYDGVLRQWVQETIHCGKVTARVPAEPPE